MQIRIALCKMLVSVLCALAMSACGGGDASTASEAGKTIAMGISSKQTGIAYDLQIYLPPGYDSGTTALPVIYAMDGPYRFSVLLNELQRQQYNKVILVMVGAVSSERRFTDFTMPGAEAYYRFLTSELIPMIDAKYRTDPKQRILAGHSLSAEFAMFALYMEQPDQRYFSSFISNDCSCWFDRAANLVPQWEVPANMEQQMFNRSPQLPVKLAMSGDSKGNLQRATDVYKRLSQRGYQGLNITMRPYSLGHVEMDGPAFGDALPFILGSVPP